MSHKTKRRKRSTNQGRSRKATPPRQTPKTKPGADDTESERITNHQAIQRKRRTGNGSTARAAPSAPESDTEADADDSESMFDRMMERAAYPGRFVTYAVVCAIIVAGWRWPRYVVNPTSLHGGPHDAFAAVIAAVLFLSFTTLTFLAYCLIFGGTAETNKKFFAAVLNRAGIGVTLGILLGVRLAPALLGPATDTSVTFPAYLSDVGNSATLMTLILISTLWPYSLGPFRQAVTTSFDRLPFKVGTGFRKGTVLLLVLSVNYLGVLLALAVFRELT